MKKGVGDNMGKISLVIAYQKTESKNGKKEDNIGRLLVAEFKGNETRLFDEIIEMFRKYPDFQKYEVDYTQTISFPNLEIFPDQRKVYCGKREVSLTTKEFNLLCYFAANEGRVLTYEQIYQKIWGNYVQDIENNTIGSHVCKLREKLYKACPDRKFEIRCVREIGYCFEAKQNKKQSDLDDWAVFCCHNLRFF